MSPISLGQLVQFSCVAMIGIVCLAQLVQCNPDTNAILGAMKPPERPKNFKSLEELNHYLDELKQYYTIIGRPRFGKRNLGNADTRHNQLITDIAMRMLADPNNWTNDEA